MHQLHAGFSHSYTDRPHECVILNDKDGPVPREDVEQEESILPWEPGPDAALVVKPQGQKDGEANMALGSAEMKAAAECTLDGSQGKFVVKGAANTWSRRVCPSVRPCVFLSDVSLSGDDDQ